MPAPASRPVTLWEDALAAADLAAVDPNLGGVLVRAEPGPVRDAWLQRFRAAHGAGPVLRAPADVGDAELLGGLDLAATLATGRSVAQRGLLARAHRGALILTMAERLRAAAAAGIAAALDARMVAAERDGLTIRAEARLGVAALDEGLAEDERPPAALLERLAFHVDLRALSHRDLSAAPTENGDVAASVQAAQARLPRIMAADRLVEALCAACAALGVGSVRVPILALKAACAAAALAGRDEVADEDAALAARLVIAPRALHLPPEAEQEDQAAEPPPPEPPPETPPDSPDDDKGEVRALDDTVLEAALAALPPGLLARLQAGAQRLRAGQTGKVGEAQATIRRGRPIGARRGDPRSGVRLALLDTLRAAAPWQRLRKRGLDPKLQRPPVEIRREDFRIRRFRDRKQTTTIFVVDASGSTALERLGEAKGAVELLLADCYVRRDEVALIAFRGTGADILLPPTRSLHRAKKELAAMPGGGGTPLAAGLMAAGLMADEVRRKGRTPTLVLITDGRANVTREGVGGRAKAQDEAASAAKAIRAQGHRSLLVDNSPRPEPRAGKLADEMGALYLPLPRASSDMISRAVRASGAPAPVPR
ncbi:MAG: magnesium chelatase subunit D [Bosea sp.]|jgi:magnesium chelatase subunit D|nr:magnesium chelatase subunit D [Bosea sp. (in: a-proteobacteria)]